MVHDFWINGIGIKTGDLICTKDGNRSSRDLKGQFWFLLSRLIPGEADHIVVYLGPNGQCVEAGAKGKVITFEVTGNTWDWRAMSEQRGGIIDTFLGVADPLAGRGLSAANEEKIREGVSQYCLKQVGKPYNLNFLNSSTDKAFYCSQLAYKAYKEFGIDLNTGVGVNEIPGTKSIIFPDEIWKGCPHKE